MTEYDGLSRKVTKSQKIDAAKNCFQSWLLSLLSSRRLLAPSPPRSVERSQRCSTMANVTSVEADNALLPAQKPALTPPNTVIPFANDASATSAAGAQIFSPQPDRRLLHRMPDQAGTQPSLLGLGEGQMIAVAAAAGRA